MVVPRYGTTNVCSLCSDPGVSGLSGNHVWWSGFSIPEHQRCFQKSLLLCGFVTKVQPTSGVFYIPGPIVYKCIWGRLWAELYGIEDGGFLVPSTSKTTPFSERELSGTEDCELSKSSIWNLILMQFLPTTSSGSISLAGLLFEGIDLNFLNYLTKFFDQNRLQNQ
jgi:hypothetical protein